MTPLETKLTDALLANAKLREEGERLIAAYVAPESDRPKIINELIGPAQREEPSPSSEAVVSRTIHD